MPNNLEPSLQMPPQLSTIAPSVDWLYYFIFWVSVVFFVGIVGAMTYFMIRYRRREGVKPEPTGHHNALELFWTFSPLIILFMMFHWGFQDFMNSVIAPDDAINIRVRGRQWAWQFEQPNGVLEDNVVHVPAGRPVRLILSSDDVLHSFFVPDFRVKRDAVPGMFSMLWFEAISRPEMDAVGDDAPADPRREGYRSQVYCTEYCGAGGAWGDNGGHATMYAQIIVQRPADYAAWVANPPPPMCGDHECSGREWGEMLFASKGCTACHQVERGGAQLAGPNLYDVFGHEVALEGGTTVTADEAYILNSIREPRSQVVSGFSPIMPQIGMSDQQADALVAYIRSLSDAAEGAGGAQ
jgi:cytochrome c oxidase subunit II